MQYANMPLRQVLITIKETWRKREYFEACGYCDKPQANCSFKYTKGFEFLTVRPFGEGFVLRCPNKHVWESWQDEKDKKKTERFVRVHNRNTKNHYQFEWTPALRDINQEIPEIAWTDI